MIDTYLRTHFENVTAIAVLQMLCDDFSRVGRSIKFCHSGRVYLITDLFRLYEETNIDCAASLVGPLRFYGGPPHERAWYTGSLLTVLFDQILDAWECYGDYRDLVEQLPVAI